MVDEEIRKWYDIPAWIDKSRCPLCNSKLVKKWEGLVCRNTCPLNFKLGKGWVYLQGDSGWSMSRDIVNICFKSKRNILQKEFVKIKQRVMIRDDYKCRICGHSLEDDFYLKCLEVHHIIPASEEMALYLDPDNLITLCKKCHKKVHSKDKYSFSSVKSSHNPQITKSQDTPKR